MDPRNLAWKALLLAFVSGAFVSGITGSDDFRLPFSQGKFLSPESRPSLRTRFWERNGRSWVIYWDEALETPRFLSPRASHRIASPDAPDGELVEAVREFVDQNGDFFGVSSPELIHPTVTPLNRHRLVGFQQGVQYVPVRGAGLRALIDPTGAIASVDCFLARSSTLPRFQGAGWLDENEVLGRARALGDGELGAMGRQVLFPASSPGSAVPGFCLEAEHEGGGASELFFSHSGGYLGAWDMAHYLEEKTGKMCVEGFSTDPDDIYSTADKADRNYPLPDVRGFVASGWRGVTGADGSATFVSPDERDNVWPALSMGVRDGQPEECLKGVQLDLGIDEGVNQDGIKTVFMIFAKASCNNPGNRELPLDLFDPKGNFPVDPDQCIRFVFDDTTVIHPFERLVAFDLLVYHHIRKLHKEAMKRISDRQLTAILKDNFPLRVIVNSNPANPERPRYVGVDCSAHLCISQQLGRQSLTPPTIVHHEYAHHVINTVVGTNQNDAFEEGLADAITAYMNKNPRIGFIAENGPGLMGFRIDTEDFLSSENLRLKVGETFWKIFKLAKQLHTEDVLNLLYVWLAQRHVEQGHQLTFDFGVLMEQLLVADAALDGTRVHELPPRGYAILDAFIDKSIFHTPFIRGDVDRSGAVDLTDAVAALDYLFLGGNEDRCLDAMDVDDSAHLDLSDPLIILNYLFLGGSPPAEPFPFCGWDPTLDLWCAETAPACREI